MAGHSESVWSVAARLASQVAERYAPTETTEDITAQYPNDPVGFARDILKIDLSANQKRILEAFRDHDQVSVASGHKIGKSTTFACAALWFYCNCRNARIVITAVTDRQVNGIIWREIKRLAAAAAAFGNPIPGYDPSVKKAATGWNHPVNESEIRGYTASKAEAVAGVSGELVVYLIDEASGVEEFIFEAIFGNAAAGVKIGMISNPTRAEGQFYRSHHSERVEVIGTEGGWVNFQISSFESPNITGEWKTLRKWDTESGTWVLWDRMIPGMAKPAWTKKCAALWGEDDPRYIIRVLGEFSAAEELKAFQLVLIDAAQERYGETIAEGRLYIGCDPAGEGGLGDDSAFVARRGKKLLEIRERKKLTAEAHMTELDDILMTWVTEEDRLPNNEPAIVIDASGDVGAKVHGFVKSEAMRRKHQEKGLQFWVIKSRPSDKASREPNTYHLHREELVANARIWMKTGGAIPKHMRLEDELHAGEFTTDVHDRLKFTPKDDLRKILGRSPDVFDAFCLSCWEPRFMQWMTDDGQRAAEPKSVTPHIIDTMAGGQYDSGYGNPYGNPYG